MSLSRIAEFPLGLEPLPFDTPRLSAWRRKIWRTLTSARLAVVLLILVAAAATLGTFVPQAESGTRDGFLVRVLGLRDIYGTLWFNGLLGLLALNTVSCSVSRLRLTWRRFVSTATHGGIVLVLAGAAVGGLFGEDGHVRLARGQSAREFIDRQGRRVPLGFAVTLEEARVETDGDPRHVVLFAHAQYPGRRRIVLEEGRSLHPVPDTPYAVRVVRRIPDFSQASDVPDSVRANEALAGPALVLEILREGRPLERRIHFAANPRIDVNRDASPDVATAYLLEPIVANYASRLTIDPGEGETRRQATVRVNDPVTVGRTRLFQMDQGHHSDEWTLLRVNHDPGLPLVYGGFVLLATGIALVFTPLAGRRRARSERWNTV